MFATIEPIHYFVTNIPEKLTLGSEFEMYVLVVSGAEFLFLTLLISNFKFYQNPTYLFYRGPVNFRSVEFLLRHIVLTVFIDYVIPQVIVLIEISTVCSVRCTSKHTWLQFINILNLSVKCLLTYRRRLNGSLRFKRSLLVSSDLYAQASAIVKANAEVMILLVSGSYYRYHNA